jgi:hypothetical protein
MHYNIFKAEMLYICRKEVPYDEED